MEADEERARERIRQKFSHALASRPSASPPLKPLPLELKLGKKELLMNEMPPPSPRFPSSPSGGFSSPRRRLSGSPSPRFQKYRGNFDLKLTEASRELVTYILRKVVLSTVLKQDQEDKAPPA